MDVDDETYILLLLSDSNLPTGSFVASSGLESYVAHGFFGKGRVSDHMPTINFLRDSLGTYARTALPFVADAHTITTDALIDTVEGARQEGNIIWKDKAATALAALDNLYECMTLNHITRRASRAQGVALLSLYSRGFSQPATPTDNSSLSVREVHAAELIDELKLHVRREELPGHLPVCWGVLTAALGLSTHRSQYLHLFLQARSILSASVRLNTIGPYAAQQLLLHTVRPLVDAEIQRCIHLRTGLSLKSQESAIDPLDGPANTWPLGEILAARHDAQHSRIFNS